MADRAARIASILTTQFAPVALQVADESHHHAGHAGAHPDGQTHFHVALTSPRFAGLGRVARSRLVHEALDQEFSSGLHALRLTLAAPEDDAA